MVFAGKRGNDRAAYLTCDTNQLMVALAAKTIVRAEMPELNSGSRWIGAWGRKTIGTIWQGLRVAPHEWGGFRWR